MSKTEITIEQAQRKVDAIDKRIDAVRAELLRNEAVDEMSAASWQAAWNEHPVLHEIERALFLRRHDASALVGDLAFKAARAAERREARQYRKAHRATFPTCGNELRQAA